MDVCRVRSFPPFPPPGFQSEQEESFLLSGSIEGVGWLVEVGRLDV